MTRNQIPHAEPGGSGAELAPRRKFGRGYIIVAITLLSVVAFGGLAATNSFEKLYRFSRSHEDWQLDELLWLPFVGTFALIAILILDSRRLSAEVGRRIAAEEVARDLARFDAITGTPNREMLMAKVAEQISTARAKGTRVALLLINIDHFLSINDTLGHLGGDRILQAIAQRLRAMLRPQDLLARLGSDEFAVLYPVPPDGRVEDLFRLAERILGALRQPFPTEEGVTSLTASIGIAKFPRDASNQDELLRDAEMALRQAKASGRNRYALFDSGLDAARRARVEFEAELREGIAANEIVAFYQPLVRLSNHEPAGAEALARWRHPKRGLLSPDQFIDIAQDIGLIGPLLETMLRRACQDTACWPGHLPVAVNISPQQLVEKTIVMTVFGILDRYGFPPSRLEIEITESALLLDFDAARRNMMALKARGVQLSLDDFGTGYSSLTHLHELPFDKLKIDRSFIQGVLDDPQRRKIVTSIIGLGRDLRLVTVAEGVETQAQADWLRNEGCGLAQGYYFAKPMPAEEATAAMRVLGAPPLPSFGQMG